MLKFVRSLLCVILLMGIVGCGDSGDSDSAGRTARRASADGGSNTVARRPLIEQTAAPIDISEPSEDATRTSSGLAYKKLATNEHGALVKPGELALVHYTGWRQATGQTFFSTRGRSAPISIDVAHAAPGFGEALRLLREGEKAIVWLPQSPGTTEPLVYELEVVDFIAPAPVAKTNSASNDSATIEQALRSKSATPSTGLSSKGLAAAQ